MSQLDGHNLFGSGPHHFIVHGLSERHNLHEAAGVDGGRITPLGRRPRKIEQRGRLLADSVGELETQRQAVEARLGKRGLTLVDHRGRSWANVVMLSFKPGEVRRLGARLALDYEIEYLQERGE